jgi:hypothetical protein
MELGKIMNHVLLSQKFLKLPTFYLSLILDMKRLAFHQLTAATPSFAAMMVKWSQDCLPIRFKKIFIVNSSKMFNIFWAIFSPFLSSKLTDRVRFILRILTIF